MMIIHGNNPPENKNSYGRIDKVGDKEDSPSSQEGASKAETSYRVRLSGRTREIEELRSKLDQVADMRFDLVKEIRKALEDGTYRVDPHKIAGRMIREII